MKDAGEKGTKKAYWKSALLVVWAAALLVTVWRMFRGSWPQIAQALREASASWLALGIGMGLLWYVVDAFGYWVLYRARHQPMGFGGCCAISFISIFSDVTTMGAATKPVQLWYSCKKGGDAGVCAGILTLPYVFQKLTCVVFAGVGLVVQHSFLATHFADSLPWLYLGAAISVLVAVGLGVLCAAPRLHKTVLGLLKKLLRRPRFDVLHETLAGQCRLLADASRAVLTDKKLCLILAANSYVKLSLLYSIPAVALCAVKGDLAGASLGQVFAMTAMVKLLMGVIPTAGGVGSLEVVFSLLFSQVFGQVLGGTLMVLFRVDTYYLPFAVSLAAVGKLLSEYRRREKNA